MGAHLVEYRTEHREPLVQFPAHTHPLRTLTGKQKRDPPISCHRAAQHTWRALPPRQRTQPRQQLPPLLPKHHRAILQPRPPHKRKPNIHHTWILTTADQVLTQPPRLGTQTTHIPTRKHPRDGPPASQPPGESSAPVARARASTTGAGPVTCCCGGASSRMTCALVPLIPNEETPERRGLSVSRHGTSSVSS